ncbi:MAG: acyltransferase domain-containing protein, partial [Caldilinea sp.]
IEWEELGVEVPVVAQPWPLPTRIAGVSAFGLSGTNAHLILSAPTLQPTEAAVPPAATALERPLHLLTLSAREPAALAELAARYRQLLQAEPSVELGDLSHSSQVSRNHFVQRLAIVAGERAELLEKLGAAAAGQAAAGILAGHSHPSVPQVAFLFTGQGAQYSGMGRELYETQPLFRESIDRCAALLAGQLEAPLLEVLGYNGEAQSIDRTENTQPALFVLEYALAQLWRSWGIEPKLLLGHSVGELAAACVAGLFSLEDGLQLVAARGRLMGALPQEGEMLSLQAPESRVREAIAPYADEVSIAAINGPASVVLSGRRAAVLAVGELLAAEGVKGQRLTVSHAFHSPLMEPMLEA